MEQWPMGRIICIANQKGGVGKTTTAVNLGASLALSHKRALVVDCDPQGNATSGLGKDREGLEKHLYPLLLGEIEAWEAVVDTPMDGLKLIPSNVELLGAEVELMGRPGREGFLRRRIQTLRTHFDYILLDCPPSLGLLTLNALTAADTVLAPIQCEYYALEGLTQLLNTIRRVKKLFNPRLRMEGILLTMFDVRNRLSHQVAAEVRRYFPRAVFKTVIPRNVRLSESPSHGLPALLYDFNSKGAQSYLDLAGEIISNGRR